MNKKLMAVLKEPGKDAVEIEIDNTLNATQGAVGGYIEVVHTPIGVVLIVDEEGRLKGLPENVKTEFGTLAGPVLVVGLGDGENFGSLTPERVVGMKKYLNDCAVKAAANNEGGK